MSEYSSLCHSKWECKYHIIFIPKYRRKSLYGRLRVRLREILHDLASQRGCQIVEGHLCIDHVHMLIRIPPKYPVSQIVGFLSAIMVAREFLGKARNFPGEHFWARGYFVSTVGADERVIRDYIRHQEGEDIKEDQQRLFH